MEEMVRIKYVDSDRIPAKKKLWWYGYGSEFCAQWKDSSISSCARACHPPASACDPSAPSSVRARSEMRWLLQSSDPVQNAAFAAQLRELPELRSHTAASDILAQLLLARALTLWNRLAIF